MLILIMFALTTWTALTVALYRWQERDDES